MSVFDNDGKLSQETKDALRVAFEERPELIKPTMDRLDNDVRPTVRPKEKA